MTLNRKKRRTAASLPAGLAIGLLTAVIATLIMTAIFAYLILSEKLSQEAIGWCAIAVLFSGSTISAWMSAKQIQTRTALVCLLGSVVYFVTMLGLTALLFGGVYDGVGVCAIYIAAGCAAAFCLRKMKIPGKKIKKAYKAYL